LRERTPLRRIAVESLFNMRTIAYMLPGKTPRATLITLMWALVLAACSSKERVAVQSGSAHTDSASQNAAPDSADLAEPDSSDVDDTPNAQVAQCMDTATITTVWFLPDSTRLVQTRLDGRVLRATYTSAGRSEVASDAAGTHAFGDEGYVDLATGAVRKLTHSADYEVRRFVDARTIVGNVQRG
jgi:hypothetical protein